MIVFGIDPGRKCGYAALSVAKGDGKIDCLKSGQIVTPAKLDYDEAIQFILAGLKANLGPYLATTPVTVIEAGFCGHNPKTALKLGEMRGAIKAFFWGKGITTVDFFPTEVKKAIAGKGGGSKIDVERGVKNIVNRCREILYEDESDAIAVAAAYILACQEATT
jgi:crossover junction endodeoxyribonuclease RuvC